MRRFVVFAILAVVLAAPVARAAEIGDTVALSGKELNGRAFDLADMSGHVVIVNFWATWCGPCRAEMPMLDKFYLAHRDEGVVMIGISEDRSRDRDDVASAMSSLHYPAAMISGLDGNSFGRPNELPVTYVIDASGIVRAVLAPQDAPLSEARLSAAVMPLLGGAK